MNKKIIILLNGKARSGKDEAYSFFKKYFNNFCERFAFADDLKEICKDYFNWDGQKDEIGRRLLITVGQILRNEIKYQDGLFFIDNNSYGPDEIIYQFKHNFRSKKVDVNLLYIFSILLENFKPHRNFWIDKVSDKMSNSSHLVNVITDLRFTNELEYFLNLRKEEHSQKVVLINIKKKDCLKLDDPSETQLDNYSFDYYIDNDGTKKDLEDKVFNICKKIEEGELKND